MNLPRFVQHPMPPRSWEFLYGDREPARHVSIALRLRNRWLWLDTDSFHCCYYCHLRFLLRLHQSIVLQLSPSMSSDPLHPRSIAVRLLSTPVARVTITLSFHHPTRQMWFHKRCYHLRHYHQPLIFDAQVQSAKPCFRKPVDNFVVFVLRPVLVDAYVTTGEKRREEKIKHWNKNEHNNLITVKWQNPIMRNEKQKWLFAFLILFFAAFKLRVIRKEEELNLLYIYCLSWDDEFQVCDRKSRKLLQFE